jgi:hypothetical protein
MWADYPWDSGDRKKPQLLNTPSAASALVDALLECPSILRKYAHLWGRLIEEAPDRSNELRKVLRGLSSQVETPTFPFHRPPGFYSFGLNLPVESSLLPHLGASLVCAYDAWVGQKKPEEVLRVVGQHVQTFVSDAKNLERVIEDGTAGFRIRAAACVLTFLHPSGGIGDGRYVDLLVKLYDASIGEWYFKSIVFCVSLLGSEADDWASLDFHASPLGAMIGSGRGRKHLKNRPAPSKGVINIQYIAANDKCTIVKPLSRTP